MINMVFEEEGYTTEGRNPVRVGIAGIFIGYSYEVRWKKGRYEK
jgi:hypothetical protein